MINITAKNLIMPYFVVEGHHKKEPVITMPGVNRLSIDNLLIEMGNVGRLGIKMVLLFGVLSDRYKDETGSYAYSSDSIIGRAVAAIKKEIKDITVMTDVCLCGYTSHGHCGILNTENRNQKTENRKKGNFIDNKKTVESLARIALVHAQAGADWVAPSAMAHKQVLAIRKELNKNGFSKVKILGYSAKFASNFYGPFREAAGSAPRFGDRHAYQLDYLDAKKALKEIEDDIKEGADMIMVKPALSYLDIIWQAKNASEVPLAAYNVSGEYAMVKYGVKSGLWDEKKITLEIISSIKRSGADFIITYHAKDIALWLKNEGQVFQV